MLEKVLTTGQVGVEQKVTLMLNSRWDVEVGGWVPIFFTTIDGHDFWLADYGYHQFPSLDRARCVEAILPAQDGVLLVDLYHTTNYEEIVQQWQGERQINLLKNPSLIEFVSWMENNNIKTLVVLGAVDDKSANYALKLFEEYYEVQDMRQRSDSDRDGQRTAMAGRWKDVREVLDDLL